MNRSLNRRTVLACGAAALLAPFGISRAQAYPSRPITLIVPWPPGGSTDRHLRTLAEIAGKHLGQNDPHRQQAGRRRHARAEHDGADRQARRLHHRAVPARHGALPAHAEDATGTRSTTSPSSSACRATPSASSCVPTRRTRPSRTTSKPRARSRARSTTAPPASAPARTC